MTVFDNATFGHCSECGNEIALKNATEDEVSAKKRKLLTNGLRCDSCDEGITPFAKRAKYQILQWLGPISFRKVLDVAEVQNASYALVTLRDGRQAKLFHEGESFRALPDEIVHVFESNFPDVTPGQQLGEGSDDDV